MLKIARLPQPQRFEAPPADAPLAAGWDAARWGAALAGVLGFLCFMPYPAIPHRFGNTAIQFGNILTVLLVVPILFAKGTARAVLDFSAAPGRSSLCISTLKVGLDERGDIGLCFKTIPVIAMSSLTLVAVQRLAPRHALALLTGIAVATVIHAGVGGWQLYNFTTGGDLPFQSALHQPVLPGACGIMPRLISRYIQGGPVWSLPRTVRDVQVHWRHGCCSGWPRLRGIVKLKVANRPAMAANAIRRGGGNGGAGAYHPVAVGSCRRNACRDPLLYCRNLVCSLPGNRRIISGRGGGVRNRNANHTLLRTATELGTRVGGQSDLGNSSWEDRAESLQTRIFACWSIATLPTVLCSESDRA